MKPNLSQPNLTSPLRGSKQCSIAYANPRLARRGLNDHATPWLKACRDSEPTNAR